MAAAGTDRPLKIIREPRVRLVGRQVVDPVAVADFLAEHELTWTTDTEVGAEVLAEMAGRLCYLSYGKGRRTNREFVGHLIEVGHGSVLEHCVWSFVITGVSRSLTHELVRHRAGWAYSQLSQRYVNESESPYVEPAVIAEDPALHATWTAAVNVARAAYDRLVEGLERRYANEPDATLRRKLARQAARSVLPNATETRIFVTANARALRHFIEMRGAAAADVEIRAVALQLLRLMRREAPSLFADYEVEPLPDGGEVVRTPHPKV